jgi:serine/threonine protein kinase
VGTQGYIPPSALLNEPATYAFDMWSLGVMLYETVFGFSPFLPHELLAPCEVQFPGEEWGTVISAELQELLTRLLHKDDASRILALVYIYIYVYICIYRRDIKKSP